MHMRHILNIRNQDYYITSSYVVQIYYHYYIFLVKIATNK